MMTFTITCLSLNCIMIMNAISPMIPESRFSTSTLSEVLMIKPTIEVPMKIANTTATEYIKHEIPTCKDSEYLVWKGACNKGQEYCNDRKPYCWEK
jgi:hypothetical protein